MNDILHSNDDEDNMPSDDDESENEFIAREANEDR
jgi:hypothetical protein